MSGLEENSRFFLARSAGSFLKHEINEARFNSLSEALEVLISAAEVEEVFRTFALSFLRFEKELLEVALEDAYQTNWRVGGREQFRRIRPRLNVSIMTILTAFQSYDDICNSTFAGLKEDDYPTEANLGFRSSAFDAHLSYRLCAKLRHYAQHKALPVHGISIGGKANVERDEDGKFYKLDTGHSIDFWLDIVKFKGSKQCGAKLREELDNLGYGKVDMAWLMRSFVSAMYERHASLREFLTPRIVNAGDRITAAYKETSAAAGYEVRFLDLVGNGRQVHMRSDLAAEILESFETFQALNRADGTYVSSQIAPKLDVYSGQSN